MSDSDSNYPANFRYRIHAASEPGLIPRVVEPFAKVGLVPERLECRRNGALLAIDLEVAGIGLERAAQFARTLAAVVGVERVAMDRHVAVEDRRASA